MTTGEDRCGNGAAPDLQGRRAVVTGGSRGIGRAISSALAGAGAQVLVVGRNAAAAEATRQGIVEAGGVAHTCVVDLADEGATAAVVAAAERAMRGVDILINNAGGWGDVPGAVGPLVDATPEGFDHVIGLNLRTPLLLAAASARSMIRRGTPGVILNMASIDGLFPAPGEAIYGAAKAALVSVTAALAYELGRHGIRCNALAPALVETDLTAPWIADEESRADRASMYPLNRLGTTADVAAAALFLCSDAAGWISGITLPITGGQQATSDAFRWVRAANPVPASKRI